MTSSVNKRGLVPVLRFPKFRADWQSIALGKCFTNVGGTALEKYVTVGGAHHFISIGNYSAEGKYIDKGQRIEANDVTKTKLLNKNDLVMVLNDKTLAGDIIGSTLHIEEDDKYIYNQRSERLIVGQNLIPIFAWHLLNSQIVRKEIFKISQGGTQIYVNFSSVKAIRLFIPKEPEEQQKIADCLTSVDELITAQTQKLDALKTHKKGLMQQLFPAEGEIVPKRRFPEFRDTGEWNTKRLDSIGRVIRGASPRPQGDPRYYGGPVPRLMVQDVTRDGKWVTPQIDALTQEGAKLSRLCPAGTLTIVCSGTVGVISFLAVDACIHDGFLALVDINESIVTKDFLFHSLSTLREQFEKGATHGGVFTNLTTSGIEQFEISCPNLPEQQRISGCLSSLDDLITAQTQKLVALKSHKKGLMQQLFPIMDEASA